MEYIGDRGGHDEAEKKAKYAHERIYSDSRSNNRITLERLVS